uniref:hypothetical protein n=1 Tax=Serratia proteamaculans TaxID=28151 RepID=UPI001F4C4CD5|nr:hypothetical protein [Serratia proteamaculans]ULG18512.1 type IV secretion system protein VirD2 [Serratia proteamaculans]
MAVESLSKLLEGKVKTKSNKTTDLKGKASRIANRASEVMVKVSGNAKGPAHVKAHLDYISRNGKLELENERGEILKERTTLKPFIRNGLRIKVSDVPIRAIQLM